MATSWAPHIENLQPFSPPPCLTAPCGWITTTLNILSKSRRFREMDLITCFLSRGVLSTTLCPSQAHNEKAVRTATAMRVVRRFHHRPQFSCKLKLLEATMCCEFSQYSSQAFFFSILQVLDSHSHEFISTCTFRKRMGSIPTPSISQERLQQEYS